MADIKQAAKWMKQGKKVHRVEKGAPWHGYCSEDEDGEVEFRRYDGTATLPMRLIDLLADDWEIAE